ncbi:MAG TPA: hypothetical protein VIL36_24195 [Acidimicrobiales bacterium]
MRKVKPLQLLLGAVGLAIGVVGVLALREATLSTHHPVTAQRLEIFISADTKGGERGQDLAEMVEAQLLACRLEVSSDLLGEVERLDEGRFRAELTPALDETDRRQFRGCVEDWVIDHVRLDITDMVEHER